MATINLPSIANHCLLTIADHKSTKSTIDQTANPRSWVTLSQPPILGLVVLSLPEAFKRYDATGDGVLDVAELAGALKAGRSAGLGVVGGQWLVKKLPLIG